MRTIRTPKPSAAFRLTAAFVSLLLFPVLTGAETSKAETGKKDAWQILETAIQADDAGDRATAIRVLGLLPGNTKAAELAGKGLDDPKPKVRAAAAAALGQMGASAAIPSLKKALHDKEVSVALAAAHALNLMKNDFAYELYYTILTGERKGDEGLIAEQLETLHDPKKMAAIGFSEGIGFVPFAGIGWDVFRAIHKNDSSPVRAAAASVLADDTDPRSGEALVNATGDKNWLVRVAGLEALAKRRDPGLLGRIEASLWDSKKEVRYTAAAVVLRLYAVQEARESKQPGLAFRQRSVGGAGFPPAPGSLRSVIMDATSRSEETSCSSLKPFAWRFLPTPTSSSAKLISSKPSKICTRP